MRSEIRPSRPITYCYSRLMYLHHFQNRSLSLRVVGFGGVEISISVTFIVGIHLGEVRTGTHNEARCKGPITEGADRAQGEVFSPT